MKMKILSRTDLCGRPFLWQQLWVGRWCPCRAAAGGSTGRLCGRGTRRLSLEPPCPYIACSRRRCALSCRAHCLCWRCPRWRRGSCSVQPPLLTAPTWTRWWGESGWEDKKREERRVGLVEEVKVQVKHELGLQQCQQPIRCALPLEHWNQHMRQDVTHKWGNQQQLHSFSPSALWNKKALLLLHVKPWAPTSLGLSDRMPSIMALSIWAMIGASSLSGSMASHMYPRAWSARLNTVKIKYAVKYGERS